MFEPLDLCVLVDNDFLAPHIAENDHLLLGQLRGDDGVIHTTRVNLCRLLL